MPPPVAPHSSRSPVRNTMAQMYTTHASFTMDSPQRFTFPTPPKQSSSSSARRTSTPDYRLKSTYSDPPSSMYQFSPSQRRSSTPPTVHPNPYASRRMKTTETSGSRPMDNRFPGPLHIPQTPRFYASPSPSPHDSPASTLINTPGSSHHTFRSPSPTALPSWRDTRLSDKLPPIRHLHPSPSHKLPHLSTARWHDDDPYSPRYLDTPSPTPSSPESEEMALPRQNSAYFSSSQRYGYGSKYTPPNQKRDTGHHGDEHAAYYPRRDFSKESDGYDTRGYNSKGHSPTHGGTPLQQHRSSTSSTQPARAETTYPSSYEACGYDEELPLPSTSRSRAKFGVRKGSRFFCTYVSPVTGERCDIWDKGWTVYATLTRHAETEHAPEELALIKRGALCYDQAQIITGVDKRRRIEDNLAETGCCPDCGTIFSSKRRDSLSRHRQTTACEKAQRRGRPPTKFPKKPRGANFQVSEVDSSGEAP